MSALLSQLLADVKSAMIARESSKLEVLRTLHSEIKNVSINGKIEISDEIVLDVIQKNLKQKRDAIEQFRAGNRQDLVDKENAAIQVISVYLPAQLSRDEIVEIVQKAIAEVGLTGSKAMGGVMKLINPQVKGKADGKVVADLVKELLA